MDELALQSEFGFESGLSRVRLQHLDCYGTQVATTITPCKTEVETLQCAWNVVRSLAAWVLRNSDTLPINERFELIVGWSRTVRQAQGQIFKTGGLASDLKRIVSLPEEEAMVSFEKCGLRTHWQKDVF